MDNIISNQYVPNYVYDDINTNLDNLKEQSNKLHEIFNQLDDKCINLEIIQDTDIDDIITILRNYVLIKENCLEKSSAIIPIGDIYSIEMLSQKLDEHRNNSLSMVNDILHYAYEFLKISSKNIITDGLLQDHKEKLKNIINTVLKNFIDIDEISEQIKPYEIAIGYITGEIKDLTEYAELLNSTFGAILFYNIISGNNIEYSPETIIDTQDIQEEQSIVDVSSMSSISEDVETIEVIETVKDFEETEKIENLDEFENMEENQEHEELLDTLNEIDIVENIQSINNTESVNENLNYIINDDTINKSIEFQNTEDTIQQDSSTQETIENLIEEETLTDIDINTNTKDTTITNTNQDELDTNIIQYTTTDNSIDENLNSIEDVQLELPTTSEIISKDTTKNTTEIITEENVITTEPLEVTIDENSTTITEDTPIVEYDIIQNLVDKIFDSNENSICELPVNNNNKFNSDELTNLIFEYILEQKYCCASLVLKQYSYIEKFKLLYTQIGLALGDPLVSYLDYDNAFSDTFNEELQPWLQLSALLRIMFYSSNKGNDSYKFSTSMKTIQQNYSEKLSKLYKFNEILNIFDFLEYNMDYVIGVRIYEEHNSLVTELRNKAKSVLLACDQITSAWKNNKSKITSNLFSQNTGYLYNLVKQISLGNLEVMPEIKTYCKQFLNEDGTLINNSILEYFEILWEEIGESKHSNDFHSSYKKFYDKLNSVLKFFSICIDRTRAFENNLIDNDNLIKYRDRRNVLVKIMRFNLVPSIENIIKDTSNEAEKVGLSCLNFTLNEIISYIVAYDPPTRNYYYISLLKEESFMLDDNFVPYLDEYLNSITGLSLYERIQAHLKSIQKDYWKDTPWWKDTIKYNVKHNNKNNVSQIITYLKDTKQVSKSLEEYLIQLDNAVYNLENKSKEFVEKINSLYNNEILCNRGIINKILEIENKIKNIVSVNGNYGFYENIISKLSSYAQEILQDEYSRDNLINIIDTQSKYYESINNSIEKHQYSVADELLCMYFKGEEYPKEIVQDDTLKEYNDIFNQFIEFTKKYANDLSSPNGYIFMNEFYNSNIKSIVNNLFAGSYDCVKSDELIGSWSKGANVDTNVVYDVLTNIGFGIDKSIKLSNTVFDMELSNSEKKNNIPYIIPKHTMFLNQLYNISQVRQKLSSIEVTEDTLIILDYALKDIERDKVLQDINEISNGYSVIVVDRCIIMYLTTIPNVKRKFAFKVCSLFNSNVDNPTTSNFRDDYVEKLSNGESTVLMGRTHFGKSTIVRKLSDKLSQVDNNIVITLDAFDNTLETPKILQEIFKDLNIKVFCDTWIAFSKSLSSYLKKNRNNKVCLLIDNGDTFFNSEFATEVLTSLKDLGNNNQFKFVITVDCKYRYVKLLENLNIEYTTLKPLEHSQTVDLIINSLNVAKINVSNVDIMNSLVARTFGYPNIIHLVTQQIIKTVYNSDVNLFTDKYYYTLTDEMIKKSFSNDDFIKKVRCSLLEVILGKEKSLNDALAVIYSMVYILNENQSCTIQDIKDLLTEDNEQLNLEYTLKLLVDLNIVLNLNNEYYFTHNAFKYYFGNSDFAISMLNDYSKKFEKDGIA